MWRTLNTDDGLKKRKNQYLKKNCYQLILYFHISQNMKHQSFQHFNRTKANRTK